MSGVEGSGSSPVASSGEHGCIGQDRSPSASNHQIGTDEDPEQKADPNVSPINNANEKSGQKSYPEQPPLGNTDTNSGQGQTLNSGPSRGGHEKPGQVGHQADSSKTVDQQQSNGGLENNKISWEAPGGILDQQERTIAIGSQMPDQAATINNHIVQVLRDAISIAGMTLSAGGPAITVSGTPIALGSNNLVVGSVSVQIGLPPSSLNTGQVTTLNGEVIQQLPTGISVAGTTLTPGAPPIMASGFPISLGTSAVIIGSSSIPIALPHLSWIAGPITDIDGEVVQPLSNGISVAGTLLTPGGPAITVSGTPTSLGSNFFVIGTSSIPLATDDPTQVVTTIAGQTITANPTVVMVGGLTLAPGSPGLTLDGTPISLNSAGQLVVRSKTVPLDRASGNPGGEEFTTTVAGQGLTANPTAVIVAGSALRPGGPSMTLSGTMVSLKSSGKLIIGSTTIALQSSTGGLGLIVGGFISGGPYASESVGSAKVASPGIDTGKVVQAFRGDAESTKSRFTVTLPFWLLCACLIRLHLL